MAHILHYYGFHISQMSPPDMVRVRHFEFLCRSHGIEPTVEKFRVFYRLILNIGFYSFSNRGSAKKIMLNPPKSFNDWKQKFFFSREEVVPIAMMRITATPNRIFGENVLVAAQMSDQCRKIATRGASLSSGFPHLWWIYGGHFLYPLAGAFSNRRCASTQPQALACCDFRRERDSFSFQREVCRVIKWGAKFLGGGSHANAGASDKGTLRLRSSNLEDYVITSDSREGLSRIGEKKTSAAGSKSSASARSRNPDAGATPSSITLDNEEEEEEQEEEPAFKLVSRKRTREETVVGVKVTQKAAGAPVIEKQSSLRSLYKLSLG
ncbi:hypothetical protein Hanom_Chr02g00115461 [Helianthus anomalus]